MTEAGLKSDLVFHCPYWTTKAEETSKEIITSSLGVTAIFAAAGDLVAGVLKATRELGVVIPDDIAVVSFDDHPLYDCFSPGITAVSQPIDKLGEAAANQLFLLMEDKVPVEKRIILPTKLVIRESCGAKLNRA